MNVGELGIGGGWRVATEEGEVEDDGREWSKESDDGVS